MIVEGFLKFCPNPKNDQKLVMISIFAFQNMKKMHFCLFYLFYKSMLRKLLGFGCMYENIFFLKKEINLKIFRFFFEFFIKILETFRRKPGILIPYMYLTV